MAGVSESNGSEIEQLEARSKNLNALFQKEVWALFAKFQQDEELLDPTKFYQTIALSLLSCAATVAVDVGVTDIQFVGMAKTLWDMAHQKAPKFS